jgi:cellobiose phosphorylase
VSLAQALRESLDMRFDALEPDGRLDWGFTHEPGKVMVDYQFSLPLAAEKYWLHTGDIDWLCRRFDKLELATAVLVEKAKANGGLVGWSMAGTTGCPNWYFDGINASGTLAYHNIFYYAALRAMAEMAAAAGKPERQAYYTKLADAVKLEFNRKFWSETACGEGNPAYCDWVDSQGVGHGHFMSLVQYPAIVVGLASKEQAGKILATANRRLTVLAKENGYAGEGTLDLLWPVAKELCVGQVAAGFGKYQNGGMLLTWTYWEIVARAQSGDAAGAWDRMKRFSAHAAKTNWFEGENSFTMDGQPFGWGSEPYLSDQVTVPAALVDGFLGVRRTVKDFTLTPALPPGWKEMSAEFLYKGIRYRVTAQADGTWSKNEQF